MLTPASLPALQAALTEAKLDGWLLFDFRGLNPVAGSLLGMQGMVTRRIFAWIPAKGNPVAITHAIEQAVWSEWPREWEKIVYSSWRVFEDALPPLVKGKRIAMEYSPGDAVPVVDRIPAGVLEMVRAAGADVVTSAELVSRFFAVWSAAEVASHRKNAESLRTIAHEAFARIGAAARTSTPLHEHEVCDWVLAQFPKYGMEADHGPIIAATENAANPHYHSSASAPRVFREGDVALIDLFATGPGGSGMWADQTWMASIGAPSARALEVWTAIRDARDAAIELLRTKLAAGTPVRGGEADNAARAVIEQRGFGKWFTHRTGHSIDARGLHGMGPNIDDLETRETRLLIPGVGFSIEPGIYLTGEIGMRTEVNGYIDADGSLVITPGEIQRDLIIV
ncbi:MAG: aminopeptidase P family protein [Gemmatimonadaceae bacterium]|nr:aminopeptidase P family protein [Gemmatimonadaceae bacterium]